MSNTSRAHFDEDIIRSEGMLDHARDLEADGSARRTFQDIRVASLAMSIGAMDAYLCDKYVDCLTAVLNTYSRGRWRGDLPGGSAKEKLPAGFVLDTSRSRRPGWGIRMAARKVMERENILSLRRIDDMFNPILPTGQKIWAEFVPALIALGRKRLTGITPSEMAALTGSRKGDATKKAATAVRDRIAGISQIRNDWIHNCARPKTAIQEWTHGEAATRIRDVKDVIYALDDHIEAHRKV
jgi:hypothetical protein